MANRSGFWAGRKVLLTGHTGFKGSWAAVWLARMGADVTGFSLTPPNDQPSLWHALGDGVISLDLRGDLRDQDAVRSAVEQSGAEIVIHMAAQALVRRSFADPIETYGSNVLGTVHLLEALRHHTALNAVLVITTDKVYANNDSGRDFVESDPLGGHDPYSASKAATELAVASYAHSFMTPKGIPIATARAGNVIGGGDWSTDRLIPDVLRAIQAGQALALRNPASTRPWQHVLEALSGYFRYVETLVDGKTCPAALNFGPIPGETMTVERVAAIMAEAMGNTTAWVRDQGPAPPEMKLLSLDPAAAIASLGWYPKLSCEAAVSLTAEWYQSFASGEPARQLCERQIEMYEALN